MTAVSWRPASRKEESLWLLERLVPDEGVNNVPGVAVRVAGRLDREVLRTAAELVFRRHDVLRTVFSSEDTRLLKRVVPVGEARFDLVGDESTVDAEAAVREIVTTPFALDGTCLLRLGLFHGPEHDLVAVAVHHLIFDGSSMSIFVDELRAAYDAVQSGTAPALDAVETVAPWPETEPTPASLKFWREHLRGFDSAATGLWCGRPESAQPTLHGDHFVHHFSARAAATVGAMQQQLRAPDAVILLAAYYALLGLHGAGPDVCVGFPVNVRSQQAQRAIGYHVNIVPLRVRFDPRQTFRAFATKVRDLFFEAIAHADVPMDVLLPEVNRADSSWRTTMFRHVFNYMPFAGQGGFTIGGLPAEIIEADAGHSKFDLEFIVLPSREGSRLKIVYGTEVHDDQTVHLLAERYEALLVAAASAPDRPLAELDGWSERDRQIIPAPAPALTELSGDTVVGALAALCRADPKAPAVISAGVLSRGDLWSAAVAVWALLSRAGARVGTEVALVASRGPHLAAGLLGSWLAGAVPRPVDPALPIGQVSDATADAGVVITAATKLVDERWHSFPPPVDMTPPLSASPVSPDAPLLAGSGGLTQRGAPAAIAELAARLDGPTGVVAWLSSPASEASIAELLLGLLAGDGVVAAPDAVRADGRALGRMLERHGVRTVHATPTTWSRLIDTVSPSLAGRTVLAGTEPVPAPLAHLLRAAGEQAHAVFGLPETGGWALHQRLDADVPTAGVTALVGTASVHAPDGRPLPVGVRGELYLTGPHFAQTRVHTGLLAAWRPDGTLDVSGPFHSGDLASVDVATMENALVGHADVGAAAVVRVPGPNGDEELVAVVQAAAKDRLVAELTRHAEEVLPPPARPARYVRVDALPETVRHTIDRDAAATLARTAAAGTPTESDDGPSDETVQLVMSLFRDLLRKDTVAPDTNFFNHGGHSLLAAQLAQHIERRTGARLKLSAVFAHPTPALLAERIHSTQLSSGS
ncbi:hypothetical protein GCM10023322_80360 [Rugosimonospora acidiphila]|uniref:Carrier domain-containing protein n=1 Tax=Rugosimonospora acidiphila TaxID=556531 RepID=A0ABP9STN2_9ACTN